MSPIIEHGHPPARTTQDRLELLAAGSVVAGLGAWRLGKGVYRFDDTLDTAIDTADGGDTIDAAVLHALPEWCVHILDHQALGQITPAEPVTSEVYGYFVWLDHDLDRGRPELRLLLDLDHEPGHAHLAPAVAYLDRPTPHDGVLDAVATTIVTVLDNNPVDLHLSGDLYQLDEHTARVAAQHQMNPDEVTGVFRAAVAEQVDPVQRVIRRVLYLVSERPDVVDIDQPDRTPEPADAGDPRKPWTAAPITDWWDVGYRVGTQLRATTDTISAAARPDVTSAHTYDGPTGTPTGSGPVRPIGSYGSSSPPSSQPPVTSPHRSQSLNTPSDPSHPAATTAGRFPGVDRGAPLEVTNGTLPITIDTAIDTTIAGVWDTEANLTLQAERRWPSRRARRRG